MSEEGLTKTKNSLVFIGKPSEFKWEELLDGLTQLKAVIEDSAASNQKVKDTMRTIVTTYREAPTEKLS